MSLKRCFSVVFLCMLLGHFPLLAQKNTTTLVNFNKKGDQITKFNSMGEAIDAHDGEIAYFDGVYYLYGTSYGCGFEWGRKDAPFCGFKAYSSTDMVHWTDRGALFDATTPVWQTRCNGNTYGCFRPHVIYNKKTKQYVLWINVYDNRVGFRVFTGKTSVGPFTEVAEPTLAVNSDAAVAGLNNGDHDTFVDEDGTGYIAYTDWRTKGTIVIEQLTNDYLSGTGKHIKAVTKGSTEAPSLFKRKGRYYLTYSDPNCGYCSGTGTSHRSAPSPLGPWSEGIKISDNSCGGQPSFVSAIKLSSGTVYLYGSDLWNNAAKNEAQANFYWAPLSFDDKGAIQPMVCQNEVSIALDKPVVLPKTTTLKDLDNTTGLDGFTRYCDISRNIQRSQSFTASRSGTLYQLSFASFKSGYPDADLTFEIYKADNKLLPSGKPMVSKFVPADAIKWSPAYITINPDISVTAGTTYAIVIRSASTTGCYGFMYNDLERLKGGAAAYSADGGTSFSPKERVLMFQTLIGPNGQQATFNKLVCEDNFDYNGVPDTTKWGYEIGFVRNKEPQWYQKENAFCKDGLLIIEAKKERKANPFYHASSTDWRLNRQYAEYTSACLISKGKYTFKYGRAVMRAKIDTRQGMWPAFWILGAGHWPACGEVDIMEYYRQTLLANAAWEGEHATKWDVIKWPDDSLGGKNWSQGFHEWQLDWNEKRMIISMDGMVLNTIDLDQTVNFHRGDNPFKAPFYLLLNLALGQDNEPIPDEHLPARMEVDYVRVYQ